MSVSAHSCILEAIPYACWFYPGSLGSDCAAFPAQIHLLERGCPPRGGRLPGTGDQVWTVLRVVPEGCC